MTTDNTNDQNGQDPHPPVDRPPVVVEEAALVPAAGGPFRDEPIGALAGVRRVNEGVVYLVLDRVDEAMAGGDGQADIVAGRVAAAAVALGWVDWDQIAEGTGGTVDAEYGLSGQQARQRWGQALAGLGDAELLAVLREVTEAATEPVCAGCGQPVTRFYDTQAWQLGAWQHWTLASDGSFDPGNGYRRPVEVGHDVPGQVLLPGPAAFPAGQVGADPDEADWAGVDTGADVIGEAGAGLLGVVHDIDFHYWTDGWTDPFDGTDPGAEIAALADRLDHAARQARARLAQAGRWADVAQRIARVRAAHRQHQHPTTETTTTTTTTTATAAAAAAGDETSESETR
jgi:hypothetical protein